MDGLKDLAGKVAVVTGGASGIGYGMAQAFLDAGMKVVIADLLQQHLDQVAAGDEGDLPFDILQGVSPCGFRPTLPAVLDRPKAYPGSRVPSSPCRGGPVARATITAVS